MTHNRFNKNIFAYIPAALMWLVIWQIASTLTGLDIVLPGPVKVFFPYRHWPSRSCPSTSLVRSSSLIPPKQLLLAVFNLGSLLPIVAIAI